MTPLTADLSLPTPSFQLQLVTRLPRRSLGEWNEWDERHGRWVGITTWAECLAVERCGKQPRYKAMSVQDTFAAVNVELHRHFDGSASSGLKPPLQKRFGGQFV